MQKKLVENIHLFLMIYLTINLKLQRLKVFGNYVLPGDIFENACRQKQNLDFFIVDNCIQDYKIILEIKFS